MNEFMVFQNIGLGRSPSVRRGGKTWFVAADIFRALEIADTWNAMARLDPDEKGADSISTPGGQQDMTVVYEHSLYTLILGSRKPEVRTFKLWITRDVIPAIRKHGLYAVDELLEIPPSPSPHSHS